MAFERQGSSGRVREIEAGWVYDVEIVTGTKVFDVKVDADKGTVISSVEDKADHDDDHDKED